MFQLEDMIDLQTLYESTELEFKLAQGRDGKGKLPDDFWPTYSAMANTRGGYIVLGVKEQHGQFHVEGLTHIEKIKQELFNGLNNSQKVSVNLLTDQQVKQAVLKGKTILLIEIPAARRRQKPVYLKNQPLNGTYLRLYDGDRHCSVEQVW